MRVSYLNAERFHFFIYKIEYISQDRLAYSVSTNSEVSLTTQNKSKSLIHPKSHKRQVNGNSSTSSDSGIPFFFLSCDTTTPLHCVASSDAVIGKTELERAHWLLSDICHFCSEPIGQN